MVILEKKVAALTAPALEAFVRRARQEVGLRGAANVLVTSNAVVRSLNRRFRRKDKDTDVLSFPTALNGRGKAFAGDIAISADKAGKNAVRLGHSSAEEIKILTLHGILHLAGFDHERDNGRMARKEAKLRQVLKLPASLIERSQETKGSSIRPKRRKRLKTGANLA